MMAKRMKRTLALALSLVMVLGLLPAAAFADFTNCSQTVVFHLYDCRYGKRLI